MRMIFILQFAAGYEQNVGEQGTQAPAFRRPAVNGIAIARGDPQGRADPAARRADRPR